METLECNTLSLSHTHTQSKQQQQKTNNNTHTTYTHTHTHTHSLSLSLSRTLSLSLTHTHTHVTKKTPSNTTSNMPAAPAVSLVSDLEVRSQTTRLLSVPALLPSPSASEEFEPNPRVPCYRRRHLTQEPTEAAPTIHETHTRSTTTKSKPSRTLLSPDHSASVGPAEHSTVHTH